MKEKKELIHFKNKFEKVMFYILLFVYIVLVSFMAFIYWQIGDYFNMVAILLLPVIILAAVILLGTGLIWIILECYIGYQGIKQGLPFPHLVLYIGICCYINSIVSNYGVLGVWILFGKK